MTKTIESSSACTEHATAKNTIVFKPTLLQSLLTGSIAGAAEVMINHPLWSIKTMIQEGEAMTFNLRVLYRGFFPNMASMVPITAIQVGFDGGLQRIFFNDAEKPTAMQRIASAFGAGVASAFASGPTEMVMATQKATGDSFYAAAKYLISSGGPQRLFAGLPATMMRDGIFSAFYLAGTPLIKAFIQPYCKDEDVALFAAGIASGIGATVISQMPDTIKARQQAAGRRAKTGQQVADKNPSLSLRTAATALYAGHGMPGFFKGGLVRGARVVSAVTIIGGVKAKMEEAFREYESEKTYSPLK
jgi:hypothetical protein